MRSTRDPETPPAALVQFPAGYAESVDRKLDEIAAALAVIMRALSLRVPTGGKYMSAQGDALKARVTEKKTVFDGLVTARDELEKKLQEALDANGMAETNAAIQEAMTMLDAFVDPKTKVSPVTDNTEAAGLEAEKAAVAAG